MKKIAYIILLLGIVSSSYAQEKVAGMCSGGHGSLQLLLVDYSSKVGKSVELVDGVHADISYRTEELSVPEYLKFLDTKLAEHNIALYPISTNRLVATWIDPSKATPRPRITTRYPNTFSSTSTNQALSYVERLRIRREAQRKYEAERIEDAARKKIRSADNEKMLRDYNLELIRAKGKKGKPLPMTLTPEEDAMLVREGVLPPDGSNPDGVFRSNGDNPLLILPIKSTNNPNEN